MVLMQNQIKDENELRESMKFNLLLEKAALSEIKVTDEEVKKYYEDKQLDIEVRHIIVEDEKTIKEVKAKLDEGEDFAVLAEEYSTDATAQQGGDLGFISINDPQLDPVFKEAAFKLKQDEISEPVESSFGWHIIQVTDKPEKEPFDKVKEEYEKELKLSKIDINKTLKTELEKSKIKVEDKDLKNTFDPILSAPTEEDNASDEDAVEEKK